MSSISKFVNGALATAVLMAASNVQALSFNFSFLSGSSSQANQAFIEAGARWSSVLSDNVTLDLTVGTAPLGNRILAQAGSTASVFSYTEFRSALVADGLGSIDNTVLAHLGTGSSFGRLINLTSDNPNGNGSKVPYLDSTGVSAVRVNNANAKALGLTPKLQKIDNCLSYCDASITFSNAFSWDFNPDDGISSGSFDFVGIAMHEIGHALGFVSGVDYLDSPGIISAHDYASSVMPLDLFRYSAASTTILGGPVIDFTADTRTKFFSIDGGVNALNGATFSTGTYNGDGNQASHWRDGLGLGILDPTASRGELLAISPSDLAALDAIGWNVASTIPEPEAAVLALSGACLLGAAVRRRSEAGQVGGQRPGLRSAG